MLFATENGWLSYADLKRRCEWLDKETELGCEAEDRGEDWDGECISLYQSDSPYAEFISGYNTDSYADGLCELLESLYGSYVDECEDNEESVDWEKFLDFCWKDFDYQLLHTWLRVTNIHNESDEEIRLFARECDTCTMREKLETV
tara:strand:- start:490 stop:927 length:438 start_codon:yes stop_codon:yes gene_type:complete